MHRQKDKQMGSDKVRQTGNVREKDRERDRERHR